MLMVVNINTKNSKMDVKEKIGLLNNEKIRKCFDANLIECVYFGIPNLW